MACGNVLSLLLHTTLHCISLDGIVWQFLGVISHFLVRAINYSPLLIPSYLPHISSYFPHISSDVPHISVIFFTYAHIFLHIIFKIFFNIFHIFLHIFHINVHISPHKGRILEKVRNVCKSQFPGGKGVFEISDFRVWGETNGMGHFPEYDVTRGDGGRLRKFWNLYMCRPGAKTWNMPKFLYI